MRTRQKTVGYVAGTILAVGLLAMPMVSQPSRAGQAPVNTPAPAPTIKPPPGLPGVSVGTAQAAVEGTDAATPTEAPAATSAAPTGQQRWRAVFDEWSAKLPGTYVPEERHGALGLWEHNTETVYIAPRTPVAMLPDVMRHESMHVRQYWVYGSAKAAWEALKKWGGWEAVADCGAQLMGARYLNYVAVCTDDMKAAAVRILSGVPA